MEVSVREKVDAGNMVGASTDGLVIIRRHFFPHGELPDGGGAVPPTAAGTPCGDGSLLLLCAQHRTAQVLTTHCQCDWLLALQSARLVMRNGALPNRALLRSACSGPAWHSWCTP